MNDKVKEQLADLLAFVKAGAEKTTEFAVEQAPLVAREIVAWEFWSAAMFVIATLFAWAIWLRLFPKRFGPAIDRGPDDPSAVTVVLGGIITGVLLLVATGIAAFLQAPQMVKSTVAPRLAIIDYIGRLAK